jgi:aromatase
MDLHTGYWQLDEDADGVTTATSQHTVVIKAENITKILGPDAGLPEARAYIRNALGTNSRATLGHAKDHAEARR